jgi:hypothetical protein
MLAARLFFGEEEKLFIMQLAGENIFLRGGKTSSHRLRLNDQF